VREMVGEDRGELVGKTQHAPRCLRLHQPVDDKAAAHVLDRFGDLERASEGVDASDPKTRDLRPTQAEHPAYINDCAVLARHRGRDVVEFGGFECVARGVAAPRQCDSSAWASSEPAVVDGGVHDRAQDALVRADGRRRQTSCHLVNDVLNVERSNADEALRPERGNQVNAQDRFVAATSSSRLVACDAQVAAPTRRR